MQSTAPLSRNPLARKLQRFATLSSADVDAIEQATSSKTREIRPHKDIVREGDEPDHVKLILSGWACRYKQLHDGRRQILAYFLPGDLCDLRIFLLKGMDHSIGAITPVRVAEIADKDIVEMTGNRSTLARALWWSSMVAESIEREWIVNLGQRSALERVGHLFCELHARLEAVGLVDGDSCEMPLTQTGLSHTVGLSTVHMNRTLQELRSQDLIVLKSKTLTFPDIDRLKTLSLFSPNYLHLEGIDRSDAAGAR